jgi:hypothetical protein
MASLCTQSRPVRPDTGLGRYLRPSQPASRQHLVIDLVRLHTLPGRVNPGSGRRQPILHRVRDEQFAHVGPERLD